MNSTLNDIQIAVIWMYYIFPLCTLTLLCILMHYIYFGLLLWYVVNCSAPERQIVPDGYKENDIIGYTQPFCDTFGYYFSPYPSFLIGGIFYWVYLIRATFSFKAPFPRTCPMYKISPVFMDTYIYVCVDHNPSFLKALAGRGQKETDY